jgi:DNA-binding transcriptional ArsR family regulator
MIAVDDALWSAMGDPTRRRILDLLAEGGATSATRLSEQLPVTRQAVAKNLGVLDRAGLVNAESSGREVRYRLDEEQFGRAVAQLRAVGTAWDARMARIKSLAEEIARAADSAESAAPADEV